MGLCGGLVCEMCFVSLMEQGGKQEWEPAQAPGGSLHIFSGAEKLLFSQALGPVFTSSGKTLSPVITDAL